MPIPIIGDDLNAILGAEAKRSWRERSACRNDPALIAGGDGEDQRKQLCFRACPVLDHCRAWVMGLPPGADTDEIAGGMTYQQRRAERLRIINARLTARKAS